MNNIKNWKKLIIVSIAAFACIAIAVVALIKMRSGNTVPESNAGQTGQGGQISIQEVDPADQLIYHEINDINEVLSWCDGSVPYQMFYESFEDIPIVFAGFLLEESQAERMVKFANAVRSFYKDIDSVTHIYIAKNLDKIEGDMNSFISIEYDPEFVAIGDESIYEVVIIDNVVYYKRYNTVEEEFEDVDPVSNEEIEYTTDELREMNADILSNEVFANQNDFLGDIYPWDLYDLEEALRNNPDLIPEGAVYIDYSRITGNILIYVNNEQFILTRVNGHYGIEPHTTGN